MSSSNVFISYAHSDGVSIAERLNADLAARGFNPWMDAERQRVGDSWSVDIETALDQAEVIVAVLTEGSCRSEICRAEHIRAHRKCKRVIPVLAQSGENSIPLYLEARSYLDLVGKAYDKGIERLTDELRIGKGAAFKAGYRTPKTPKYLTPTPQIPNRLDTPDALAALRNLLFSGVRQKPREVSLPAPLQVARGPALGLLQAGTQPVAVTAIKGMAGIGKTVLAAALCDDEVVNQAFPDGIVWITLGRERIKNLCSILQNVARVLGDENAEYADDMEARSAYAALLRDKAALIVVDDVWIMSDVEEFRPRSRSSRLLFTTRDDRIADHMAAAKYEVRPMNEGQSLELLANWANRETGTLPPAAKSIVRECGGLPLALALIGATLRDQKNENHWKQTVQKLQEADVSWIERSLPDQDRSFYRAIQVSVDRMDETLRDRYRQLAVLLEDTPAHPQVLQTIWNTDAAEVESIANGLAQLSLAQVDEVTGSLRLHDLQLDFLRARTTDREGLATITEAMRLAAHVIEEDPGQLASQMLGRLLAFRGNAMVDQFCRQMEAGAPRPFFRPISTALVAPGRGLVRTIDVRRSRLRSVAISGTGEIAWSGSFDGTLQRWDLRSGDLTCKLAAAHRRDIRAVRLVAGDRLLLSASADKKICLWDADTGDLRAELEGHLGGVNDVSVSTQASIAVSAASDSTVGIWNLETGALVDRLEGHRHWVTSVAITDDGETAISGSADMSVGVWDLRRRKLIRMLSGHTGWVTAVVVSRDGSLLASASEDRSIRVWDGPSARKSRLLTGHQSAIRALALDDGSGKLLSGSDDRTLRVWDINSDRLERTIDAAHGDTIHKIDIDADGNRGVSVSSDGTLRIWKFRTQADRGEAAHHVGATNGVAASDDGNVVVSGSADRTVKVWNVPAARLEKTLTGHDASIEAVAITKDGSMAASGSRDQTIRLWNTNTGELEHIVRDLGIVYTILMSDGPDPALVFGTGNNDVSIWTEQDKARPIVRHSDSVHALAIHEDPAIVVSGSADGTLYVTTEANQNQLRGHTGAVMCVAMSEDGQTAISGSIDSTIRIWDLEALEELRVIEFHAGPVRAIALSRDGRHALSASDDKKLCLWDLRTGKLRTSFTCEDRALTCCFAGLGHCAVGDRSGKVYLIGVEGLSTHAGLQ